MTDAPAPLVPAEVDLTDFAFMPLDVARLLKSDTWIEAPQFPNLSHALISLWCAAWHQVPAGSLPNKPATLERFSGLRSEQWEAVRERAMQGWILCSDGRFYHPVIAEKALEGWDAKQAQRSRTRKATEAKKAKSAESQGNLFGEDVTTTSRQRHDQRDVNVTFTKGQGQGQGQGEVKQEQGGKPPVDPLSVKQDSIRVIAEAAREAFNASKLVKPQGGVLSGIALVTEARAKAVKAAIPVVATLCAEMYGDAHITSQFWQDYFAACADDPWLSGKKKSTDPAHANWKPDFVFLLKPERIAKVYEDAN